MVDITQHSETTHNTYNIIHNHPRTHTKLERIIVAKFQYIYKKTHPKLTYIIRGTTLIENKKIKEKKESRSPSQVRRTTKH